MLKVILTLIILFLLYVMVEEIIYILIYTKSEKKAIIYMLISELFLFIISTILIVSVWKFL